ncbi:MAG: N-acetyl-gamma-glutamyl-phosphate reductase, partial [Microbacteriaceae bacterium]|nr:N-acetyl-gamma-glutamyl-phosphate reductase [Microbacteriaceae bacterium]
ETVTLTFTPVLVPMFRGILAVNTAKLVSGISKEELSETFESAYGSEKYIELLPEGSFPDTKDVEKTNRALIGFAIDEATNRVVVISAVDNLVKGTAGAALQSMNLALGFDESLGVPQLGAK